MEQGRRAIWPRTTVTLTIGTSNVGSSPTPATTAAPPTHTHTHTHTRVATRYLTPTSATTVHFTARRYASAVKVK